jgi:septation ring formation regulator EzrA
MDFITYWKEIIAGFVALSGSGAAGGIIGKKLVDKEQNKRIKSLEEDMSAIKTIAYENKTALQLLGQKVDRNEDRDSEVRNEIKEVWREMTDYRKETMSAINRVDDKLDQLITSMLPKRR